MIGLGIGLLKKNSNDDLIDQRSFHLEEEKGS